MNQDQTAQAHQVHPASPQLLHLHLLQQEAKPHQLRQQLGQGRQPRGELWRPWQSLQVSIL